MHPWLLLTALLVWTAACVQQQPTTTRSHRSERSLANSPPGEEPADEQQAARPTDDPVTFNAHIRPLLAAKCSLCHGESPVPGGDTFDVRTYDDRGGRLGAKAMATQFVERTRQAQNRMPPADQPQLSEDDLVLLAAWVQQGSPEGTTDPVVPPPYEPSILMTAPAAALTQIDQSFAVTLAFTGVAAETTWNLSLTSEATDTAPAPWDITGNQPLTVTTTTVNTAALTNGTYYVRVTLNDSKATAVTFEIPVTVIHPGAAGLAFTLPAAAVNHATALPVAVAITDAPVGSTWSVRAVTTPGAVTGGTLVASNVSVATLQTTIDLTPLMAGTYYLYATIDGLTPAVVAPLAAPIGVGNSAPAMTSVTVGAFEVNTAQPRAFKSGTAAVNISLVGSDPDGDALTFNLEYNASYPAGSWQALATGVNGPVYTWNVPMGLADGLHYRVRATASDGTSTSGTAVSGLDFGIRNETVSYASGTAGNRADAVLGPRCGGCHGGGAPQSGINLSTFAGATAGNIPERMEARALTAQTMPPGGAAPPAERDLLQYWLWFGLLP